MTPPSYDEVVFEVPTSLSPSRVEQFTSCPLAFRFASIERLPERPSIHTTRGSLVHRALELAYMLAARRTRGARRSIGRWRRRATSTGPHPDFTGLGLSDDEVDVFDQECRDLVTTYLTMEDPTTVQPIGLELRLSADVGSLALRGIIDRLELRDGGLVVTDYKTGRAPSVNWEQKSLAGVHFYSFLCERVFGAHAGRHPAAVPEAAGRRSRPRRPSSPCASSPPAPRPSGMPSSGRARAATSSPRPSARCASCSFQPWCPSFGGDPDRAAAEAPASLAPALVA